MSGLLASLSGIQPVSAQAPTPSDNDVNRVAGQLYRPVCENIPLEVCSTTACAQWRELIREKLAAGWNDEQIRQYFAAQYGDRVLAEPPRKGLNLMVYFLPPLLILGGGILVYSILRNMRKKAIQHQEAVSQDVPAANEDPYFLRLEEELKKRQ